jgi:predicted Zn-dependent protease with MMP-like domain
MSALSPGTRLGPYEVVSLIGAGARSRYEAHRQIRETVIHELGHYFGLDDEQMIY